MPRQEEPPYLGGTVPDSLREWADDVYDYLLNNRVIDGIGVTIDDAPGGGKKINAKPAVAGQIIYAPFEFIPFTPDGQTGKGWGYININSWLLSDGVPTHKVTITGLGKDGAFQLSPGRRAWLKIDLSAIYGTSPGPITATIEHGIKWAPSKSGVFPKTVEYNTDDGSRLGTSGNPPSNTHQIAIYIPICYIGTKDSDDPFHLIRDGQALLFYDSNYIIQQLDKHLVMGSACIDGASCTYALTSPYPAQPA